MTFSGAAGVAKSAVYAHDRIFCVAVRSAGAAGEADVSRVAAYDARNIYRVGLTGGCAGDRVCDDDLQRGAIVANRHVEHVTAVEVDARVAQIDGAAIRRSARR